jgi:hypothetical protein
MPETLPMLAHDPRPNYRTSRLLRLGVFSLVVAIVLTSTVVAVMGPVVTSLRHVPFIGDFVGGGWAPNVLIIGPLFVAVAALIGFTLWEAAGEKRTRARSRRR